MPHRDETGEEGERSCELIDHEGILHAELILRCDDVMIYVRLDPVHLIVDLRLSQAVSWFGDIIIRQE